MKKGFTLLELIIVIIIVGTLATLALPQYFRVVERARTAEATRLLGMLRDAQVRYYAEKSAFTTDLAVIDIDFTAPKFFDMSLQAPAYEDPDPVIATATRNDLQRPAGYGAYQITIQIDGTTACVGTGECARLGY